MGILGQTCVIYQKMRKKIPHLSILIYKARINAEKRYAEKTDQKIGFKGVEIAWFELKSNKPVGLTSSTCWMLLMDIGDADVSRFILTIKYRSVSISPNSPVSKKYDYSTINSPDINLITRYKLGNLRKPN